MDQLIERLRSQTDGLDGEDLRPAPALPSVIRRGRRHLATLAAAGLLSVVGAAGAVAVVGPAVLDQLREPAAPEVLGVPESPDEPDPAAEEPTSTDEEVGPVIDDAPEPDPTSDPQQETTTAPEDDGSEPEPDTSDEPQEPSTTPDDGPAPDRVAPDLVVAAPAEGATVTNDAITFSGTVEPGASVKVGQYSATVGPDGAWTLTLIATAGRNTVTFTATDASGNETTTTRTVTYEPPTAAPVDDGNEQADQGDGGADDGGGEAPGVFFSAQQQASELTSAPFTNVYTGTAPAGQKVKVTSRYGSAHGWADQAGNWRIPVTFTPPPGTKNFRVTVKLWDQPDTKRTFNLRTVNNVAPVAFTASQQRSELTSAPYTNTYSGTTTPGTKVKVVSDHGWGYAWADDAGNWTITVTFDPPAGTTSFPVTARHYHDASVARGFTLTTVAAEAAPFTAGQQRATVTVGAPSNTYGGTGVPGREVLIWTEAHGQTTTVIGADGTWAVTLVYSNVTVGDRFDVKARDTASGTAHWFTVEVVEG